MTQGRRCRGTSWLCSVQEASGNSAQLRAHGDLAAGGVAGGGVCVCGRTDAFHTDAGAGTCRPGRQNPAGWDSAGAGGAPQAKGLSQGGCCARARGLQPAPSPETREWGWGHAGHADPPQRSLQLPSEKQGAGRHPERTRARRTQVSVAEPQERSSSAVTRDP